MGAVWNPHSRGEVNNKHSRTHVPRSMDEEVWVFGPTVGAAMWKIWADRYDTFDNLMSVVHAHVVAGTQFWQHPGAIFTLDAMTIGRQPSVGSMTDGQHRIEVFLYAMYSSPMVLSFDLAGNVPDILLNREILAI